MSSAERLRIFLIDGHPVVRDCLARLLVDQPEFEVVGQAGTAGNALEHVGGVRPHVVLVELNVPDKDGSDLIAALRVALCSAKVVVVSAHADDYRVAEALGAGAHGYLLKTSTIPELLAGIRTAASGGTPLAPSLAGAVLRAARGPGNGKAGSIEALSRREIQVLRHLATGLSTLEVAAMLALSPKTIETHRCRIYEKLHCKSAVNLTRVAVRAGLVEL